MPHIYVTGGYGFAGELIEDRKSFIQNLRDVFASAGWAILQDNTNSSTTVDDYAIGIEGTSDNNHKCYFKIGFLPGPASDWVSKMLVPATAPLSNNPIFGTALFADYASAKAEAGSAGYSALSIQAFLGSSFSTGSLEFVLFVQVQASKYFLSLDEDSFGIIVVNWHRQLCDGVWGGFYERVNTLDQWAWGIGLMDVRLRAHQVAKSAHNSTNWWSPGYAFATLDDSDALNIGSKTSLEPFSVSSSLVSNTLDYSFQGAYGGLMDRFTSTFDGNAGFNMLMDTPSPTNLQSFAACYGAKNYYDQKCIIGRPWLVEGRNTIADYSTSTNASPLLYYRGYIKHMVTGLLSLEPTMLIQDSEDLARYYLPAGARCKLGMQVAGDPL